MNNKENNYEFACQDPWWVEKSGKCPAECEGIEHCNTCGKELGCKEVREYIEEYLDDADEKTCTNCATWNPIYPRDAVAGTNLACNNIEIVR